jgi:cytidylate kinase
VLTLEKAAKAARKEMRGERKVERQLKEAQARGNVSEEQANRIKAAIQQREKSDHQRLQPDLSLSVAKPIRP